jgi:hypothetical protein
LPLAIFSSLMSSSTIWKRDITQHFQATATVQLAHKIALSINSSNAYVHTNQYRTEPPGKYFGVVQYVRAYQTSIVLVSEWRRCLGDAGA